MKNYYQILGLEATATQEEIKRNYREYASKFHPDIHQGDSFFKERFQEIQEAYDVLKNSQKREEYDLIFGGETNNLEEDIPPSPQIIYFMSSQQEVAIGDIIYIDWEVNNAQTIIISLFNGHKTITFNNLPTHGVKKIKISSFNTSIYLTIQAIGFTNQEIKSKDIIIKKKDEVQEYKAENSQKNKESNKTSLGYIIVTILFYITFISLILLIVR